MQSYYWSNTTTLKKPKLSNLRQKLKISFIGQFVFFEILIKKLYLTYKNNRYLDSKGVLNLVSNFYKGKTFYLLCKVFRHPHLFFFAVGSLSFYPQIHFVSLFISVQKLYCVTEGWKHIINNTWWLGSIQFYPHVWSETVFTFESGFITY